jgi:lysine---8-amino-7-oxononanoate aminotransferase
VAPESRPALQTALRVSPVLSKRAAEDRSVQAQMIPTNSASSSTAYQALLEKNRRFLWNPFTQMKGYLGEEPVVVARAEGAKLVDVEGKEYWDGNSSLWLNVHGHNRAELNEAIVEQLGLVAHSTLLGMASVPALELAERLVAVTPPRLGKVFYSDSGATAVEAGLKMALAYWRRLGRPEKRLFVGFENGYHGDTIGAVGVGGIDLFHSEFGPLLFPCERVPYPYAYRFPGSAEECARACLDALGSLLAEKGDRIACLVVEPLIQGAGGMITMPPGFLSHVERLCREHEVLLFADEVATGFGRTGALFACEHERVEPDLMAIGKGLTGGYLPVAATLTSDAVYDAFYGDFAERKTFYHGHSFTGNQLGCAVALASLGLLERDGVVGRVQESARLVERRLARIAELPHVGEARQCGLMVGIEIVADRETKQPFDWEQATGARICRRARDLGMITRPLGDVVVFMPPLASKPAELEAMLSILEQAIADVTAA